MRGLTIRLLHEPVGRLAVFEAVILEAALAGLIADRAVERVINQQEFHDHLLMFDWTFPLSVTITVPSLAGVWQPGTIFGNHLDLAGLRVFRPDLDLAHPAVRDDREGRMPAVVRDVVAEHLRRLDGVQRLARRQFVVPAR